MVRRLGGDPGVQPVGQDAAGAGSLAVQVTGGAADLTGMVVARAGACPADPPAGRGRGDQWPAAATGRAGRGVRAHPVVASAADRADRPFGLHRGRPSTFDAGPRWSWDAALTAQRPVRGPVGDTGPAADRALPNLSLVAAGAQVGLAVTTPQLDRADPPAAAA